MDYIKSYIPFISFRISAYKVIYFLSNDTNESYLIGLTFFDTYAVPMYDGNSCISTFFGCKINHYLEFFYSFFYGSPLIKIKCLSDQHTTKLYIYKKI